MRKPNPTITKVQVRHRAFTVFEQFREWLIANHQSTVGAVDCDVFNAEHFCQRNCANLQMHVKEGSQGSSNDMLRIILTGDQQRGMFYTVAFLEYFEDDEGQPAYYSVHTEEFMLYDFYKALECFMQRWESLQPWKASTIRQTPDNVCDMLYSAVGINFAFKTNVIMCPKELHARLLVSPSKLHVVRPDCGEFAKKVGGKLRSVNDSITILEDSDTCHYNVDDGKVKLTGYTGNKNKHGSGSLDHISW